MRRIRIYLLAIVVIGSIALSACGGTPTATTVPTKPVVPSPTNVPPTEVPSPTAVVPVVSTISRDLVLDPAITKDADSLMICSYLFDGLFVLDVDGNPQPALATSWVESEDKLDYILTLRQGVKFSDGADFNADVVLANFNRWFDPADAWHGNATYAGWLEWFLGFKGEVDANQVAVSFFDGIEKVDDFTVILHLGRVTPDMLKILAQPYFAILEPGTSAGTGTFVVASNDDAGLTLTPNANYWGVPATEDLNFGWK